MDKVLQAETPSSTKRQNDGTLNSSRNGAKAGMFPTRSWRWLSANLGSEITKTSFEPLLLSKPGF